MSQIHQYSIQNQSDENPLTKSYQKSQFLTILTQLMTQNSLYYCQDSELSIIYDKIILAKGSLKGEDLANFAQALKVKNIESFQNQLVIYNQYISSIQHQAIKKVKCKDFFQFIIKSDYTGYLTDSIFHQLKQDQFISIDKFKQFIKSIQSKFRQDGIISIPHKITIKHSVIQEDEFEFQIKQSTSIQKQIIISLKQLISENIFDSLVGIKIQKQLTTLEQQIKQVMQKKIPLLSQQIHHLEKVNYNIKTQLSLTYETLEQKNEQIFQAKQEIIKLNESIHNLSKELLNAKVLLSETQQEKYQYIRANQALTKELTDQKQRTSQFFHNYQHIRQEYQEFVRTIRKTEQLRIKQNQQQANNIIPMTLRLQQAEAKIKQMKQQKDKLISDFQANEHNYYLRIDGLEKDLQEARLQTIKATKLKISGNKFNSILQDSRLFRSSRRQNNSIYSSVVSIFDKNKNQDGYLQMSKIVKQAQQQKKTNNKCNQNQQSQNSLDQLQQKVQQSINKQRNPQDFKFNFFQANIQDFKKCINKQNQSILNEKDTQVEKSPVKNNTKTQKNNLFISSCQLISKSGSRYKKCLIINRKGIYYFDTKLRLQKQIPYQKIHKIAFCYYNLDIFVISFKRKQSPMKKKTFNAQSDLIIKCLHTQKLIDFLSQVTFKDKIFCQLKIMVTIQKQQKLQIMSQNQSLSLLQYCSSLYNPFKLNLSLKSFQSQQFYAELSRQNLFSRSFIIICLVQSFGVYCFQWMDDQLEKDKKFIYLLPFVKRLIIHRDQKECVVRLVYEDWDDGKTFLLRFKNKTQAIRFQYVVKHQIKHNLTILQNRKLKFDKVFN